MSNTNTRNRRRPQKKINHKMRGKLVGLFAVVLLALVGLLGRITYINATSGSKYKKQVLSQAQQKYESQVLPAKRGDIYDKNGNILATSNKVYNVILDCKTVNSDEDYVEPTIRALNEVLGIDEETVRSLLADSRTSQSQYQVLTKQLSMDKKKEFEKYKAEDEDSGLTKAQAKERANIKGVWFEEDYLRSYPFNETACDTIGFALDRDVADIGLEGYYNSTLTGVDGRQYGYINDDSDVEQTIIAAVNGKSIQTSIDIGAQQIVEKYVNGFKEAMGAKNIGVIVENPSTGEIIAMDGGDRYDLNNPRDLSYAYSQDEISAMTDEGRMDAWNQMWRNFCVNDTYEPGSPAKPMTVAAGLEEGVIGQNDTFLCDGGQDVGGYRIKCSNIYGHGILTLEQSLMKSCNDAMMQIAAKLGVQRFAKYQKLFGMGQKTGIDLPGEAYGLIYNADNMGPTDLAVNSFGQSYNSTMIQMAAAFASVINGGSYYEPHVVKQILNDQGSVVKKIEPNLVRETVSQSTSDFIRHALFMTVDDEEGTGKAGRVAGYKVGGKTGTAEKLPRSAHNYLVSFCGFAPADDPQLLVYVVIDTPNLPGKEQAHSTFATEVFQKIMAEALPYLNVFPDTDTTTEDAGLTDQSEGITNNNEGGLEPGTGETEAETEAPTDAEGNVIQTEPAPEEEVIPYDDGLGLPDDMPSDGSESAAESAGEAQSMESVQETETLENGAEETTQAAQ